MNFCPKCGCKLEDTIKFCEECGADLREKILAEVHFRGFAYILDMGPVVALSELILWLLRDPGPSIYNIFLFISVYFLVGFFYFWLFEVYNNGQTIGKWLFKIQTVDINSLEITTKTRYAINNLVRGTPLFLLDLAIGLVKNPEDPDKRIRWSQELSKTIVIKSNRE